MAGIADPDDFPLPRLREDLRIEDSAPLFTGAPAWVIYDPARHRYFQIGRQAVEMLSSWAAGSASALCDKLAEERGWRPDLAEVKTLVSFLFSNELTIGPAQRRSSALAEKSARARPALPLHLAKTYLFFRIPLVRPDRFLRATAPVARLFFSRTAVALIVLAGVVGLFLSLRQLDAFLDYASRFISLEGAAFYAGAIVFVKIFHELGHAYQATLRGVRVMTMGIAFMVMFPLLYTDVSDAWRTKNRRDKLMIDAGGVLVELCLAALATLLWVFLPDGAMRSAAFAVATTSWVLSLFVNLNPFMRFDGYYFLADASGIQNLQPRGFAMCRWWIRETLFGLGVAPPEPVSRARRLFMIWYAAGTWVYRFFLFIAIALIVYHVFFKALGVLLFAVEIAFFILLPVIREVVEWGRMRGEILRRPRAWLTFAILGGLIALFAVPLPLRVHVPGYLAYREDAAIYPVTPGRLVEIDLTLGADVRAGDVLARIASPEIDFGIVRSERRIEMIQTRLGRGVTDAEDRAETQVLEKELESERETLTGLARERALLTLRAPFDGVVVERDPAMVPGRWIGRRDLLARIVVPEGIEVKGYIAEDDLGRIDIGDEGVFAPDDAWLPSTGARLSSISEFAVPTLDPGYLASTSGGPIPVEPKTGEGPPLPFGSWFAFRAIPEPGTFPTVPQITRGTLVLRGTPESLARRTFRQIMRVLIRESSL